MRCVREFDRSKTTCLLSTDEGRVYSNVCRGLHILPLRFEDEMLKFGSANHAEEVFTVGSNQWMN